jgi:hypothetical protein
VFHFNTSSSRFHSGHTCLHIQVEKADHTLADELFGSGGVGRSTSSLSVSSTGSKVRPPIPLCLYLCVRACIDLSTRVCRHDPHHALSMSHPVNRPHP